MTTEMEQLKKNTEQEAAKQRRDSLVEYVTSIENYMNDRDRWHERARTLEGITLLVYWGSIIALGLAKVPFDQAFMIKDFAFLVFLITAFRSMALFAMYTRAIGELHGCIETLRRLGMIKEEEFRGPKKKVRKFSVFSRYKEFWERMGNANKQDAYA